MENQKKLKKKDKVYYIQIFPTLNIYNILELKIRGVYDTYYVGIEKRDKICHLFYDKDINKTIFLNRAEALEKIKNIQL